MLGPPVDLGEQRTCRCVVVKLERNLWMLLKLYINMFHHTYAVNIVTTVLMFIPPLHANNANPDPVTKVVAVSCPC